MIPGTDTDASYTIGDPTLTANANNFTSNPFGCGYTLSITAKIGTITLPSTTFAFITYTPGSLSISASSNDVNDVGTYEIIITG